jgi:hypothetical protein
VSGLVFGLLGRAPDPEWEAGGYLIGLGNALLVALVSSLCLLALDYARIRVARDGSRGMLRAYAGGLGFVVSNLGMTYGIAIPLVLLLVALVLGYVGYEANTPAAGTWGAIAAVLLVQQVTVLGRVFLRIALVGAERRVDLVKRPAAPSVPATVPAVAAADSAVPVSEVAVPAGVPAVEGESGLHAYSTGESGAPVGAGASSAEVAATPAYPGDTPADRG